MTAAMIVCKFSMLFAEKTCDVDGLNSRSSLVHHTMMGVLHEQQYTQEIPWKKEAAAMSV